MIPAAAILAVVTVIVVVVHIPAAASVAVSLYFSSWLCCRSCRI